MPNPEKIVGVSVNDLVMHFAGYALLFVSATAAFGLRAGKAQLLVLLFSYSVLIEVGQHFVPNRHFDLRDMAANFLGLLAGMALVIALQKAGVAIARVRDQGTP